MTNNTRHNNIYKVIILGDSNVGKTCLQINYVYGTSTDLPRMTAKVDILFKYVVINGETKKIELWDTVGQERFRTIMCSYLRGSNGVVLVYDITNRNSYDSIKFWLHECEIELGNDIPKVIVGNKKDIEESRQIPTEEGENFARQLNLPFFETSKNDSEEIDRVFSKLLEEMMRIPRTDTDDNPSFPLNDESNQEDAGGTCNCIGNNVTIHIKNLFGYK